MPTVLLTNYYAEKALQIIRQAVPKGFGILPLEERCKEDLIAKAAYADYFLAGGRIKIDEEVLDAAVRLKMIQRTGVGTDIFDFDLLKRRGIPLYVNKGINARSVAEHTIMLMLSTLRRLPEADAYVRTGAWPKHELGLTTRELYGKIVGLIGLGHIGIEVAKMLKAFGVFLLYFDPQRQPAEAEQELNAQYCPFLELLGKADIVSLHCPLSSATRGIIGRNELSAMKAGSVLINTARGPLVDEAALVECLQKGHVAAAGIDVYSTEPPAKKHPLFSMKNAVLTPHIGGVTSDAFSRMMREGFENIVCFEEGNYSAIESSKVQLDLG